MRPLDDSTNGLEESAFEPISELAFTQIKNRYVHELNEAQVYDDQIKAAREVFEASIAAIRAKKAEHEANAEQIKMQLIEQARLNYQSSGRKTFAGVQYRETKKVRYASDEFYATLAETLEGTLHRDKPLVKIVRKIDEAVLKDWYDVQSAAGNAVPNGLKVEIEPTIALVKEK